MNIWAVVRPALWASFRTASQVYLTLSGREYRYVFILGHMRSGSTLLSHLLGSHPDFAGAGETHIAYQTPDDLPKLVTKTCELLHKPFLRAHYIVDQINHPYVSNEVLASDRVYKCIILVREPEATLKSLMTLLKCNETEALDAYLERLETLTQYAQLLKKRAIFMDYDDLVDRSTETLAALTDFLDLDAPLTPAYQTHRMTARVGGFGDPSRNIQVGQIIRTSSPDIPISKNTLLTATGAFDKCRRQLEATVVQAIKHPAPAAEMAMPATSR